jgi:hypothetical protein
MLSDKLNAKRNTLSGGEDVKSAQPYSPTTEQVDFDKYKLISTINFSSFTNSTVFTSTQTTEIALLFAG